MSAKLTRFREPAKRFLINSAKNMKEPLGVRDSFAVAAGDCSRMPVSRRRFRLLGRGRILGKCGGVWGGLPRILEKVPRNLKKVPRKNNILRQKKQRVPWTYGVASLLGQQTRVDGDRNSRRSCSFPLGFSTQQRIRQRVVQHNNPLNSLPVCPLSPKRKRVPRV